MRFNLMAIAATVSMLAAPAFADDAAPKPEKKICRRELVTGSIMPKTTCHTKAEWQQIDQANANNADSALGRSRDQQNNGGRGG